ncbi:ABC transporter permease [Robiginitalea biformata]|uniref:Putative FtsX-related transmembrane transport protein n=1 Tax=Robiginitalea biformata (strain ATCC BAA-864 / DSM 15991 / KCTC 12146 / HTCC2501) TaxID=313596 RepID=A4CNP8_ROBBH|nr:ABC transporter permease [Robiginitalea biformata]EAR14515.1 putative FtsX-related transmembrane transport protein [Robiginitalea biformata HTCC2501]
MLRNYFKIAWRNLWKNKVYSGINIIGLAAGMAVTLLIGLWVTDELDYNSHFPNRDRIAQFYQTQTFNGKQGTGSAIPRPLEFAIRESYNQYFEHIVMSSWQIPYYLEVGDKKISREGNAMQEGAVDMLSLEILQGDPAGLKEPSSIMLSESAATALFGDQDPVGQILRLNSEHDMQVTAVYRDIPNNTNFGDMDYLIPWKFYAESQAWIRNAMDSWGNNSFQLFVQLKEGIDMADASEGIRNAKYDRVTDEGRTFNPQLMLLPMTDWYLRGQFENGVQSGGRIEYVWLFAWIGLFVLILACINFMNLSTARSEKRAREVGIRKSIGSSRGQIIRQFLGESLLTSAIAFVLAVAIVLISLGGFNQLTAKEISFPWGNSLFWTSSLAFIILTALLAGSYPALYLSSFQPVKVLKGTFRAGRFSALPRKILVVTQFTISVALIIGTLVIMKQIHHAKNRPMGYNTSGLIQIPVMSQDFSGKYDLMRNEFKTSGAVVEMSASSSPTTSVWSNRSGFTWEGKDPGFQEDFAWVAITPEYASSMGLKITRGRDLSRDFATDSLGVLLNETAVEYMGVQDPIGMLIRDDDDEDPDPPLTVVGVVEDMIMQSPYEPVKQTMFVFDRYENISYYNLRLNPERSVTENLATVEAVFKRQFPNLPFQYDFVDERYAQKFASEERVADLALVFTILAILISCLGLFGLTAFVAERRTKEIGVRKVLGARVSNIWMLLSKDFLQLVLIACLVAFPIAWWMMDGWIQKFTYRTTITWFIFAAAGLGALTITVITVSFQAVRAATQNPVKSLRTE